MAKNKKRQDGPAVDAPKVDAPKVLTRVEPNVQAVFYAEIAAATGLPGSNVAIVKSDSGKCHMFGRDALALHVAAINGEKAGVKDVIAMTLTNAEKMAEYFGVQLYRGADDCRAYVASANVIWAGKERIKGDAKKGTKGAFGRTSINYGSF